MPPQFLKLNIPVSLLDYCSLYTILSVQTIISEL